MEKKMSEWKCGKCGHEVLAAERPEPIRWTDGHVCHFAPDMEGELEAIKARRERLRAKGVKEMPFRTRIQAVLRDLGFRKSEGRRDPGVDRSWWRAPVGTPLARVAVTMEMVGVELHPDWDARYGEISGPGWYLSLPDQPDIETDWVLGFYRKNKYGKLERMGIDATDLAYCE